MPRMRTAAGVLAIIREQDPGSEISMNYIRGIIKTGQVPVAHVGKKRLVDADRVISYIAEGPTTEDGQNLMPQYGIIRRVSI